MSLNDPAGTCPEAASPRRGAPPGPTAYRFRVTGHLDDKWAAWFGDGTLSCDTDGTSSLVVAVPDQAALHGVLSRIRDLGITLISVEALWPPITWQGKMP